VRGRIPFLAQNFATDSPDALNFATTSDHCPPSCPWMLLRPRLQHPVQRIDPRASVESLSSLSQRDVTAIPQDAYGHCGSIRLSGCSERSDPTGRLQSLRIHPFLGLLGAERSQDSARLGGNQRKMLHACL
jgi:hypothetical protein